METDTRRKWLEGLGTDWNTNAVTNVTGELPSVEDTIDTTKDDAEAQMRVAVSTLKAALSAAGTEAGDSVA